MLVFGLGYDSKLWYHLTNKNTYFIENNKYYIDMNKDISQNIIYYEYDNNITVKNSFSIENEILDNIHIPNKILENAPYDIIFIDSPTGLKMIVKDVLYQFIGHEN